MSTTEAVTLRACPFCGKQPQLSDSDETGIFAHFLEAYGHTVLCDGTKGGCGATCGYWETPVEAMARWNGRHDTEPLRANRFVPDSATATLLSELDLEAHRLYRLRANLDEEGLPKQTPADTLAGRAASVIRAVVSGDDAFLATPEYETRWRNDAFERLRSVLNLVEADEGTTMNCAEVRIRRLQAVLDTYSATLADTASVSATLPAPVKVRASHELVAEVLSAVTRLIEVNRPDSPEKLAKPTVSS